MKQLFTLDKTVDSMHKIQKSVLAILLIISCLQGQSQATEEPNPREFAMEEGDTTYIMKQYVMVMLMRGDQSNDYSEEELEEIQSGHLANINRLADDGKIVLAGPFGDDTDLRGIFLMDVGTVEEAEALVASDPAIKAGRLKAEYHPWWGAKGTVLK